MEEQPLDILRSIFEDFNTLELIKLRLVSQAWRDMIERAVNVHKIYCNNKFCDKYLYILRNAEWIDMRFCRQITDNGLKQLQKVKVLNIAGCHKITDLGLSYLAHIEKIDFSGCPRVTGPVTNDSEYMNIPIKLEKTHRHEPKRKTYKYHKDLVLLNANQIQQINADRCQLFDRLYLVEPIQRDEIFMRNYQSLLPDNRLLDYSEALVRLSPFSDFISQLEQSGLDALIGGSIGLACVYREATFRPNDIDLYIKEINLDKLQLVEDLIYATYRFSHIVVVRNSITMSWYIEMDHEILTIQANLFHINSWAEVFVTYHADLTCIGYEVKTRRFMYMNERWERTLTEPVHSFSNILSFDSLETLSIAASKYQTRGFQCSVYHPENRHCQTAETDIPALMLKSYQIPPTNVSDTSPLMPYIAKNYLPHVLCKYRKIKNKILFGSTVAAIANNFVPLPIIYLSVYKIEQIVKEPGHYLYEQISLNVAVRYFNFDSESAWGQRCHYTNQLFTVGIECPKCGQKVSMNWYVTQAGTDKQLCSHLVKSVQFKSFKYHPADIPKLIIV